MKPPEVYKNFYDIVILPPPAVMDYAIKLSQQIYSHGRIWHLGKRNFIPHISLYHIPVLPKKFNHFIKALNIAVSDSQIGSLQTMDLQNYPLHKMVMLMTNKPNWLRELSLRVIKRTLPYYNWNFRVDKLWGMSDQPKGAQANFARYGTPNVGRYFQPHITLGKYRDQEQRSKLFRELKNKNFRWPVKELYVCELGTSLSCQRIVKKIKF